MNAIDTLISALEGSPEVRPGTAPTLVSEALAEVRADERTRTLGELIHVAEEFSGHVTVQELRRMAAAGQAPAPQPETTPECRECEHPAHRPSDCTEQRDGDDCACSAGQTPAPDLTPIPLSWDRLVMHPAGEDDHTIVACMTDDGRPAALFLDDEHREALGLQLVDPDGEGETAPQPKAAPTVPATEYRVRADGRTDLLVRREPNGTRWAIIEAVSDRGVRRARTPDGWDMVYLLGGDELFAWPDAASAVAEAQRVLGITSAALPAAAQAVCPVCQNPGCCCRCFGKTPRPDCPHQNASEAPEAGDVR